MHFPADTSSSCAHAKVIHAHLNSQLLQFPDALQNTSGGTEQGTLRDLKNQLDVMQIDFLKNSAHLPDEYSAFQLLR